MSNMGLISNFDFHNIIFINHKKIQYRNHEITKCCKYGVKVKGKVVPVLN
jgi:hypothetical protein